MKAEIRNSIAQSPPNVESLCLRTDKTRCLMVWLLELQKNATAEELTRLSSRFKTWKIVFVHSFPNFSPMVEARVIFEALPPLAMLRAHPGLCDWSAWLQDRRALLMSKWSPEKEICYGLSFNDYAALVPKRADAVH
jgi:hypothetical protein